MEKRTKKGRVGVIERCRIFDSHMTFGAKERLETYLTKRLEKLRQMASQSHALHFDPVGLNARARMDEIERMLKVLEDA